MEEEVGEEGAMSLCYSSRPPMDGRKDRGLGRSEEGEREANVAFCTRLEAENDEGRKKDGTGDEE